MNLFLSTRRLTKQAEDHLTEFIAAALTLDSGFARRYVDLLVGPYAEARGWKTPELEGVNTQVGYSGRASRPDMLLTLKDGHVIVCEHKLEAPETLGAQETSQADKHRQLYRYLCLPVDGVAYFRSSWKPPTERVLLSDLYIRPANREHFLWRDIYPLLEQSENPFLAWLREGFEQLGFTPPLPLVGDLMAPDRETRRAHRRNFAKLWGSMRTLGREVGWTVRRGSIVELSFTRNRRAIAERIFVSPAKAERFLVSVTPKSPSRQATEVLRRIDGAVQSTGVRAEVGEATVVRQSRRVKVIQVITTLRDVLGDASTVEQLEKRLTAFVGPILRALS
ncbi:MAG: hypothetical protein AMJ46_14340 [Latescibacteria bacterium DG_63]|nr:MAG: hypothetical protein AMJ46_14340 [Latescibacteria bacterium DG_63]